MHLAGNADLDYAWPQDNEALSGPYEFANYDTACGGGEPYTNEVEWVMTLAEKNSRVKGILARIPIEQGEAVIFHKQARFCSRSRPARPKQSRCRVSEGGRGRLFFNERLILDTRPQG